MKQVSWVSALLALVMLSGCGEKIKTGGPSVIEFSKPVAVFGGEPRAVGATPEGKLLSGRRVAEQMQFSVSDDGGRNWSRTRRQRLQNSSQEVQFSMPNKMATTEDGFHLLDDQSGDLIVLSKIGAEPWRQRVEPLKLKSVRGGAVTQLDGGKDSVVGVTEMDGFDFSAVRSLDNGESWEKIQAELPTPKGYKGWVMDPIARFGNAFQVKVDSAERIHILAGDVELEKDQNKLEGALYLRSLDGVTFEAEYVEGDIEIPGIGLGENSEKPDEVYRCFVVKSVQSEELADRKQWELRFQKSDDGGASWSRPVALASAYQEWGHLQVGGHGPHLAVACYSSKDKMILVCASNDGGLSWSAPQEVMEGDYDYRLQVHAQGLTAVTSRKRHGKSQKQLKVCSGSWK